MHDGQVWINGKPAPLKAGRHRPSGKRERRAHHRAHRFIETLPDGRQHLIFKLAPSHPLDNMPAVGAAGPPVRDGRQPRQLGRQPRAGRPGGVGLLPVQNLVGRVDALVGSWDLGLESQPIWTWPSGLRLSRFFTAVH